VGQVSTGGVQVVILCEDQQQECFIRRFLILRRCESHELYVRKPRPGRGSAEQFVREEFPRELKAYRSRSSRCAVCLIVCIDADNLSVEERTNALMKACTDTGVSLRRNGEKVCFVVPKRNIETWLAYLRGEPVDEQGTYRKYSCPSDCQGDVKRLDEMCRQQKLRPNVPPSLALACEEFKLLHLRH
jgi:hypothetical protein